MIAYFFLGDDPIAQQIKGRKLGFKIPKNFPSREAYRPDPLPDHVLASVPDSITTAVFEVMDATTVPIDALNPFVHLRNGQLPEFVPVYFMDLVPRDVKHNISRFFTAMHLIEMYREYVINPVPHFMTSIDTAAVQSLDSKNNKLKEDQEDKSKEEEKKATVVGSRWREPSSSEALN